MSCPCDRRTYPPPLEIPAGLTHLPRQIATFPQFRSALLASVRRYPALADWRARDEEDLGVMVLEMWAYLADALAFYDEVIAHELYLRTARCRPSLRKLVELLGYVPRPAVGATVELAVLAEGRQPVLLPAGTAFRSGAFDDEAPQVFELTEDVTVHPLLNDWTLAQPRASTIAGGGGGIGTALNRLLLDPATAQLKKGDVALVEVAGSPPSPTTVSQLETITGQDGAEYVQVTFHPDPALLPSTAPEDVTLHRATQMASPWRMGKIGSGDPDAVKVDGELTQIVLDGLYRQIKPGQRVILSKAGEYLAFPVSKIDEVMMHVTAGGPIKVPDENGDDVTVLSPPVQTPVTRLHLEGTLAWSKSDAPQITLHYAMVDGGTVVTQRQTTLGASDPVAVAGRPEAPADGSTPSALLLVDKNEVGVAVDAELDLESGDVDLGHDPDWDEALTAPITAYGNVVQASRGEMVTGEILGSGDASRPHQSFKLKKKPLTHLSAPSPENEQGVRSTLVIHVGGVKWREVPHFFGTGPADEVYVVRQNDDGESTVTFGDGRRGARLPTGADNVVATYRFGAGAARPPAGSITQLARPVKGLTSVRQPVAASGGDDAESAENLRTHAPQSALLLGRVVSIRDVEAVAAGVSGVRTVTAGWRWHASRQRPLVQLWYIGEDDIEDDIRAQVRSLAEPTLPLAVTQAEPEPVTLSLSLRIDARYVTSDVVAVVRTTLLDKESGVLAPERVGIGQPLYRSRIFAAALAVEGVVGVDQLLWNGDPLTDFGKRPAPGHYFDFEGGALNVSGKAAAHG